MDELLGMMCVALSAVLFGCMPLLTKVASAAGSNVCMIALGRFFFGALFAASIVLCKPGSIWLPRGALLKIFKLSLLYAAMPLLLYASYQHIDSGLATTLHFSYPVVVMLFSALICHQSIKRRQLVSLLFCLTGLLCLMRLEGEANLWGITLAVLSGVVYAVYIVFLSQSGLQKLSVFVLTFWLALFATIELTLAAAMAKQLSLIQPPSAWLAELGLGLLTTTLALALFQKGVFLCGEMQAALASTLEPVTGVLLGCIALQESLNLPMCSGLVLILLASLVLLKKKQEQKT